MHGMLLIGCGNMARHGHCPQLKKLENLKLVSACDVSVEKAEAFKNEFGFERFSGDYKYFWKNAIPITRKLSPEFKFLAIKAE